MILRPEARKQNEWNLFETMDYELERLMDRIESMDAYMQQRLELKTGEADVSDNKLDVSIEAEGENVVLSLAIAQVDEDTVSVEVEGKTLTGEFKAGNKKIEIEVKDSVLRVSETCSVEKKVSGDEDSAVQSFASASTQIMSLPHRVGDLDSTKVELKDGMLVLAMPKFAEPKRNVKKLGVAKN